MGQAKVYVNTSALEDVLVLHPWKITKIDVRLDSLVLHLEGDDLPELNDKGEIAVIAPTYTALSINEILNLNCYDLATVVMLRRNRLPSIAYYDKL